MVLILKDIFNKLIEQSRKVWAEVFGENVEIFTSEGLTEAVSGSLDREEHFELIYALVKVFIFGVKNAIV